MNQHMKNQFVQKHTGLIHRIKKQLHWFWKEFKMFSGFTSLSIMFLKTWEHGGLHPADVLSWEEEVTVLNKFFDSRATKSEYNKSTDNKTLIPWRPAHQSQRRSGPVFLSGCWSLSGAPWCLIRSAWTCWWHTAHTQRLDHYILSHWLHRNQSYIMRPDRSPPVSTYKLDPLKPALHSLALCISCVYE